MDAALLYSFQGYGCSRKLLSVEKKEVASISFKESPNQERVFSVHLTNIDRILQSIPSPGPTPPAPSDEDYATMANYNQRLFSVDLVGTDRIRILEESVPSPAMKYSNVMQRVPYNSEAAYCIEGGWQPNPAQRRRTVWPEPRPHHKACRPGSRTKLCVHFHTHIGCSYQGLRSRPRPCGAPPLSRIGLTALFHTVRCL
ncbi:hypothetical protein Dsin_022036 [Dipteronia sinensis]|uniref:Uncharacterized protein n=1 Tax=Dipteronia sinensis TaxID=43782 RepID=A0AAE0A285_9ROSI|nr:hypothetical protein Dsin_022036 [Dipteronia sinensis]